MKRKYPLNRACKWCDTIFVVSSSRKGGRQFCNVSCSVHWRWVYRRAVTRDAVLRGLETQREAIVDKQIVCGSCGKMFVKIKPNQIWCSKICCRHMSDRRCRDKPGYMEAKNAHRRERNRLKKIRRKERGEQRRAEIAAMVKSHADQTTSR